jgi:hypothetical protein
MRNRIQNNIILLDDKENVKHDKQLSNKINEQTLLGPNLENIIPTKILAKDNPK